MTENDIHTMELHEEYGIATSNIIRVPGGWIYTQETFDENGNVDRMSSCFVPFSKEFVNK